MITGNPDRPELGVEREAAHGAAKAERARLQRVMAILQKSLPPPDLPRMPGLDAAAYHRPASVDKIGGESCDLFPLGLDRGGFFLDDVCGRGPKPWPRRVEGRRRRQQPALAVLRQCRRRGKLERVPGEEGNAL